MMTSFISIHQVSMVTKYSLLLLLCFVPLCGLAADETAVLPKEIKAQTDAVRRYLLDEDYPELFKDKPYRVRMEDIIVADIDNDGAAEAIVLFYPHYRQSPTVAIFQFEKTGSELKAHRVFEGLAPGPLVPLTGQYLDSHTLGMAVDIIATAKPGAKQINAIGIMEAARKSRLRGLVQYKTFFHADGREGRGSYVDMTHLDMPSNEQSCANFEFSRVTGIAVGAAWSNDPRLYIAANTGNQIYIYRVDKIDDKGYLVKSSWVMQTPPDFQSFLATFEPRSGTPLLYKSTSGELRKLPTESAISTPNQPMQPTVGSGS